MLFSFYSTVIPTAATPATQWKVYRGTMGPQRGTEEHGQLLLDLLPRKGSYINRPKIHFLLFVFELFCFVLNPQITLLSSSHLSYSPSQPPQPLFSQRYFPQTWVVFVPAGRADSRGRYPMVMYSSGSLLSFLHLHLLPSCSSQRRLGRNGALRQSLP